MKNTPLRHRFWRVFYDRTARLYDPVLYWGERLHFGSESQIREEAIRWLDLPLRPRILDLGCGTGSGRFCFAPDAYYLGLDASVAMLRQARKKNASNRSSSWVLADALRLPVQNAIFDLVFCMGVLQHLSSPAQAINKMLQVCVPGGWILLVDEHSTAPGIARRMAGDVHQAPAARSFIDALSRVIPESCRIYFPGKIQSEYFVVAVKQDPRPKSRGSSSHASWINPRGKILCQKS